MRDIRLSSKSVNYLKLLKKVFFVQSKLNAIMKSNNKTPSLNCVIRSLI